MSERLTWTRARPTEPGFYFHKDDDCKVIVTKVFAGEKDEALIPVQVWRAERPLWAGPILEPVEVEEVEDA